LFETDENGILTGRYFGRCNVKDYQNGYMPKGKKEIPCREIEILVKDGHYQELGENPNMVLAWYLSKRTVDDFKGLVRRVQSGKFKPNKKNRELWDRFIDYFDIKNAKF
jgi:hypothetical protein